MISEEYKYQVGDAGKLRNGIDTYRVVAIDAHYTTGDFILVLVVSNSGRKPGERNNTVEQSMDYNQKGWSLTRMMSGGVAGLKYYDLTPPGEEPPVTEPGEPEHS